MKLFLARDIYKLKIHDPVVALDILKKNKIKIYNLKKIDKYIYTFESPRIYRKKLSELFNEIMIIRKIGILARLEKLIKSKTTLFSILIAAILFSQLAQRVYIIDIKGDSTTIEPIIREQLKENGLSINSKGKELNKLIEIERSILSNLKKEIEYIEIRRVGVVIKVRYQKRRTAPVLPEELPALYATKDGIIHSFLIKKGLKMVKENDYVKKGDLLVNDKLLATNGEEIHLGCEGKVMAYTWYNYTVTHELVENQVIDEAEAFLLLLDKARLEISKEITEGEYIDNETVISVNKSNNLILMKINYILVEDITI